MDKLAAHPTDRRNISAKHTTTIAMAELQKKLQDLSDEFQKIQVGRKIGHGGAPLHILRRAVLLMQDTELQTVVDARQKLEAQQKENKDVQKVGYIGPYVKKGMCLWVWTGIQPARRRCEHLQACWAGAAKAGEDRRGYGCRWATGFHREGNVSCAT